mmetsp:Transcript_6209/g.9021  ORF Transcript_6209/g.9021 Transcript_6209/m.9021 type:complete len:105 (-) Transcript_6209:63-377(-)
MADKTSSGKGVKRLSFEKKEPKRVHEVDRTMEAIRKTYSKKTRRNARLLGIGLFAFVGFVYMYSMRNMGQEDFSDITIPTHYIEKQQAVNAQLRKSLDNDDESF